MSKLDGATARAYANLLRQQDDEASNQQALVAADRDAMRLDEEAQQTTHDLERAQYARQQVAAAAVEKQTAHDWAQNRIIEAAEAEDSGGGMADGNLYTHCA